MDNDLVAVTGNNELASENDADVSLKLERNDYNTKNRNYIFDYYELETKTRTWHYVLFVALFITTLLLGIGTYIYSSWKSLALMMIFISGLFIALDVIALVYRSVKRKVDGSFAKRYQSYQNVLKQNNIFITGLLAENVKQNISTVTDDLKKAIRLKLIPEGHFGTLNFIFMVDDQTYNKYKKHHLYYDKYYRNMAENLKRKGQKSDEVESVIQLGKSYVQKIKECNDIIQDQVISDKLDTMEKTVAMVFRELDTNPDYYHDLHLLWDYYLPTTQKLLETYIELDESDLQTAYVVKTKTDIEKSLDTINHGYKEMLEKFYLDKHLDISSDISVMEQMMNMQNNEGNRL